MRCLNCGKDNPDKIVVSECLDYDIYAKLDRAGEDLLFKAHSENWSDELFVRDK